MSPPCVCPSVCMPLSLCVCPLRLYIHSCIGPLRVYFLGVYVLPCVCSITCMSFLSIYPFVYIYPPRVKIHHVYVFSVCIHSTPEVYSEVTLAWWGVKNDKLAKELVREWHSVQFRPNFIRWRPFDGMAIGNCSGGIWEARLSTLAKCWRDPY